MAFQISRCVTWRKAGTTQGLENLWGRVAYATRYGNATMGEALELDQAALQGYIEAVSDIVRKENRTTR